MRKIFTIGLLLIIFSTVINYGVYADSYDEIIENIEAANDYYKQMNNENFEDILESYNKFVDDHINEFEDNFPHSAELAAFSGCYYNVNNDYKLDIYLTSDEYIEYYKKYFSQEHTNFHIVDNSIFELKNQKKMFKRRMQGEIIENIDIPNNSISFNVDNYSDFCYLKYIENVDVSLSSDLTLDTQSDIYGGRRIFVANKCSGTITCNAYRSSKNKYGVITAAHVISGVSLSSDICTGSYVLCKRNSSNLFYDVTYDVAFVPNNNSNLNTTWQYSNTSGTQTGYYNGAATAIPGTKVCVLGYVTSERYATVTSDGTDYNLVYKYTGSRTEDGDSGAPVVVFTKSGKDGRAWLVGVHRGILIADNSIGKACDMKYAAKRLGITVCS